MIVVDKNNNGDFASIQEAINHIGNSRETIYIKKGVYKERIEIKNPGIRLIGESKDEAVITNDYYAYMKDKTDEKIGTFNSYTMLIYTDDFFCKSLTVENSAGYGENIGQAVSVYAEGDMIIFENCSIKGRQDTLFTGPLPFKEIEKNGFKGPTQFSERRYVRQIYRSCYIEGDVDFIFGSAAAYFDSCEIHSLNRGIKINGYVTASSAYKGAQYGYVFSHCKFTSDCPPNSVYLGRPWRNYAQAVLIECEIGEHITSEGFHDWNKKKAHQTVNYALYNCKTHGKALDNIPSFVKILTDKEAEKYKSIPWQTI